MLKDKISLLILSCDKFSDLWDGHIKLYNDNWQERDFETFIVTDKETTKSFSGINIISVTDQAEWTDRLRHALQAISTDYVFITLDDYFLIEKVDNERMNNIMNLVVKDGIDYVRFFKRPVAATREPISELQGMYNVETDSEYSVNLYPGIWKKEFLLFTLQQSLSAWRYEVALRRLSVEYGAKCVVDKNKDFVILDVVRKGKLLRDANKYFKKHPGIYMGNRELQGRWAALKLWFKTMSVRYMPNCFLKTARKIYVSLGGTSFADYQ